MMIAPILALALQAAVTSAAPSLEARAAPTITASGGNFVGATSGTVQQFYGIPFAEPPVGNLRFRLPKGITSYNGTIDATNYGPSCPQQAVSLPIVQGLAAEAIDYLVNSIFGQVFPDSEDCLTLNVVKPASATASSKLPVLVWIFGGGFELGSTSMYDGSAHVTKSQKMGQPVIFVSMNYRLNGLGFLASKEVRAAGVGNLGLHDQREALRWIKRNIAQFGGDPSKVTIWGESAGAISAALQMTAFDGNSEGLFRGAFMQSGTAIPVGPVENGQGYYDSIVKITGCSSAQDTLDCLRGVPYDKIKAAIDTTPSIFAYQSLRLAWLPRADGIFLTENPMDLVQKGKVANIPYIMGNCDDEGTLFSLSTLNAGSRTPSSLALLTPKSTPSPPNYPATLSEGSPFNTGLLNALTPQFKRIAAFQGDGVFQAPRRWFMRNTVGKQKVWAFMSRRLKALPILGSAHATDLLNSFFLGQEMQEYLIRFTNNLDPNSLLSFTWPEYNLDTKRLLVFKDGILPLETDKDDHREAAMDALNQITLVNPV
ncbi:carotenoid ester lipase [Ephemerocybe angulata]|uniref:Carboxylic ester hydrolase n=1 Tax=Ephemerocybe angulata TaxID=980116 RepID=A0A8H6I0J4_9AGAR|nr:carotenoid ester lipase [Tulosesus angulatus]